MSLLDKADITEQTAHDGHTEVGTRPTLRYRVRRRRVLVPPSPTDWSDPEEDNPDSCVYFLYSAGKIKIGTTINIGYRHGSLTGASPLPVFCVGQFTGGRATERGFHEAFKADRLHGEWFTLSDDLRWLINRYYGSGLAEAEADFKKWLMEQKP